MTSLIALSLFSLRSTLSPPSSFLSLLNSVNLSACSGLWRTLRELITGWICLSPFDSPFNPLGASLVAQRLKCLSPMQETRVRSLGQENPLEKEMATHSSILAWRIPWTEEPGRLQSTESDTTERLHFHFHFYPLGHLCLLPPSSLCVAL